ncbi:MAG TPA: response regulator [bacterium]|nr:response regulator [bacterium]
MEAKKMIFVVDDDQTIRYSLQRYLSKLGFEVKTLANGFEVLLLSMYMVPDLLISDIRMPKLDGVTLLKALKNNEGTKNVPVIFMSAYPRDEILEEAKTLGAKYFLIKPFPLEYLDDLLHRAFPEMMGGVKAQPGAGQARSA